MSDEAPPPGVHADSAFHVARGGRVSLVPSVRHPIGKQIGAVLIGELLWNAVVVSHVAPIATWASLQWLTVGTQVRVRRVRSKGAPPLEPGEWECVEGTISAVDWPAVVLDPGLVWSVSG